VGTPMELYEHPQSLFVAGFIGSPKMALVNVQKTSDGITFAGGDTLALPRLPAMADGPLRIGVRPDAWSLSRDLASPGITASVVYTEYLGENAFVYTRLTDGTLVGVRTTPNDLYEPDESVQLSVDQAAIHYFSAEDGQRLPA
jgi:lactose/L-arabinose transport system ATP-binding protein